MSIYGDPNKQPEDCKKAGTSRCPNKHYLDTDLGELVVCHVCNINYTLPAYEVEG